MFTWLKGPFGQIYPVPFPESWKLGCLVSLGCTPPYESCNGDRAILSDSTFMLSRAHWVVFGEVEFVLQGTGDGGVFLPTLIWSPNSPLELECLLLGKQSVFLTVAQVGVISQISGLSLKPIALGSLQGLLGRVTKYCSPAPHPTPLNSLHLLSSVPIIPFWASIWRLSCGAVWELILHFTQTSTFITNSFHFLCPEGNEHHMRHMRSTLYVPL